MTSELKLKIANFASEWIQKTGRESLTETLQGYDFVEDCYRDLTNQEQNQLSKIEFLDLLQSKVAELF